MKRFFLASFAVALMVFVILLIMLLMEDATGLSLPGDLGPPIAFFYAFFVGGRIGGSQYFWLGILLFLAIEALCFPLALDIFRAMQWFSAPVSWLSFAADRWLLLALSLVASTIGLILGGRVASSSKRSAR